MIKNWTNLLIMKWNAKYEMELNWIWQRWVHLHNNKEALQEANMATMEEATDRY